MCIRDRAATFQNSGQVLSIGIYFSLMVIGLASKLPHALFTGLVAKGLPASAAYTVAHTSPVATLFAALLGANAVTAHLSPHVLHSLSHSTYVAITRRTLFPHLISPAFADATTDALRFSVLAFVVAAAASWLRGSSQRWGENETVASPAEDEPVRGALVSR